MEDRGIVNSNGERVNLISVGECAGNGGSVPLDEILERVGLKTAVTLMKSAVSEKRVSRIHVLRASEENALVEELLSIEGSGTLIESNFVPKAHRAEPEDVQAISGLFRSEMASGNLRHRPEGYFEAHFERFTVVEIDSVPVACVEMIPIDDRTVELAGIVVSARFLDYKIGRFLVENFEAESRKNGKNIISVTANPKLMTILERRGYVRAEHAFPERSARSPGKPLFFRDVLA